MKPTKRIHVLLAACLGVAALMVGGQQAHAWHWTNSGGQMCNPDSGSDIQTLPPPQAMLMLDRSGSMGGQVTVGNTCNQCDYDATLYGKHTCRFSGQYCEEDGWWDDWHSLTKTFDCSWCRSRNDCRNAADGLLEDYAEDKHWGDYCGIRRWSMSYSNTKSISGDVDCDTCSNDNQCRDRLDNYLSSRYSNYSLDSVDYYRESSWWCSNVTRSKWDIAVDAIDVVTRDMTASSPDTVEFGLGTYEGTQANIRHEASANANWRIMNTLNSLGPAGGTPTSLAIHRMLNSATVKNAPGGSAGVLLTDGAPTTASFGSDAHTETIQKACEHRAIAPLYVVGFGGGTDEEFNDVVAAAGGTGTCSNGDPCSNPGNWSSFDGNCDGSYQADNEAALKVALAGIAREISCTFSLSAFAEPTSPQPWDEQWQGCKSSDYDCLKINLGGTTRVYHIDSPRGPRGWDFASPAHNSIRILDRSDGASGDYCQLIRDGLVTNPNGNDVSIQLACLCREQPNSGCSGSDMNPPARTCECPVGRWRCNQGMDICRPERNCPTDLVGEGGTCSAGVGACERQGGEYCTNQGTIACDATPGDPSPETCNGIDDDCDGLVDEGLSDGSLCHVDYEDNPGSAEQAAMKREVNRCNIGIRSCSGGSWQCDPLEPMPEVCNGVDDDCNGVRDNLSTSWDNVRKQNGDRYTLPSGYEAAACYERDVCSCPTDSRDEIEGKNFTQYVLGWGNGSNPPNPTCKCGEGMTP
ncbi:VWA domain-containing protein [Persicimonas caeni]|uniref:VWA domain-containing protein n=1 Tax=Persicimonas caeni TaxID=2292766 RepID=A0A4Y6PNV0_PERCE|nr:vWA domain-containing protein [Persicimonas caeni]QDG49992.1 VWA domain-containing protein [Persicimonas caeni]QED31213.1 VWA domain-containing protein [Persicimonas caeni]